VKKELVLVISTDKGLCGALNTNLLRETGQFDAATTGFVSAGRKAQQYIVRARRNLIADFQLKESPTLLETKVVSKFLIEKFLSGEVDKVSVLFTHFQNTLVQKPMVRTLLPISAFDLPSGGGEPVDHSKNGYGYQFEPDATDVLSGIPPTTSISRSTR
jgi:F-type H+-transporting ATPase subunit gamma